MNKERNRDDGSATVEVAIALPVVVLVLAASLGGVSAALVMAQAQDAAAVAARMIARGDGEQAAHAHVAAIVGGAVLTVESSSDLRCASVTARPRILGIPVAVTGRACALGGG